MMITRDAPCERLWLRRLPDATAATTSWNYSNSHYAGTEMAATVATVETTNSNIKKKKLQQQHHEQQRQKKRVLVCNDVISF